MSTPSHTPGPWKVEAEPPAALCWWVTEYLPANRGPAAARYDLEGTNKNEAPGTVEHYDADTGEFTGLTQTVSGPFPTAELAHRDAVAWMRTNRPQSTVASDTAPAAELPAVDTDAETIIRGGQ